jgi:hypothetical protein
MTIDVSEMTIEIKDIHTATLHIDIPKREIKAITALKPPLTINITHKKKKRSLSANSYLWVVADEIAKVIRSTKEAVYQKAVREVGVWSAVKVKSEAADKFIRSWNLKGIGWFAEKSIEENGWTEIVVYYGSSIYSTSEMSRLIDWMVDEAQELEIDVMTPEQRSLLLQEWESENEKC